MEDIDKNGDTLRSIWDEFWDVQNDYLEDNLWGDLYTRLLDPLQTNVNGEFTFLISNNMEEYTDE